MRHHAQLLTYGGWGFPSPPAFAFDLLKSAAIGQGDESGLQRYGKAPGAGSDDARPVAPVSRSYFRSDWNNRNAVIALVGDSTALARLLAAPSPFGGAAGLSFTDSRAANVHAFGLPVALGAGESFSFVGEVFPVAANAQTQTDRGHVWHLRIGDASGGVVFQARDGNAEIARLAPTWTRANENTLRSLWALETPTPAETDQIDALKKSLYSTFESLSFERSVGRDTWRGSQFELKLIPEPRGALHVVLVGADGTIVEFRDLLEQENPPPLWNEGARVEVGATGGAWMLQSRAVAFQNATLDFGPYQNGYWANTWNTCVFSSSFGAPRGAQGNALAGVTFERVEYNEVAFGFRATFTSTDPRYGAWLYGLSARLPNGARDGINETIHLDSDAVTPSNVNAIVDPAPILDVDLSCDESGRRGATVKMRDIEGRTSSPGGLDDMVNRVASLKIDGAYFLRAGIVARGEWHDLGQMAEQTGGSPQQFPVYVTKSETTLSLTLDEGWEILSETLCDPPPIGDGLKLGEAVRRLLRVPGFTNAEIARVPEGIGPVLSRARGGEKWANVPDAGSSVESAIGGLLDRYGLGLRFYRDENGVWVLEPLPTAVVAEFTSSYLQNDPELLRGGSRSIILSPLDWQRDPSDYHNAFKVVGGKDGAEITRQFIDDYSMTLGGGGFAHSRWLGRLKRLPTLRDSGLLTEGAVNYALQSLRFRHGRPGRLAQFVTYLDTRLRRWDRVRCDGVLAEVVSWRGTTASDTMQLRVREVV